LKITRATPRAYPTCLQEDSARDPGPLIRSTPNLAIFMDIFVNLTSQLHKNSKRGYGVRARGRSIDEKIL